METFPTLDKNKLPQHVAIIMDGNGRWAESRNLPRSAGHKEGLKTTRKLIAFAREIGIKFLTIYVFSTENWKRTEDEVGYLMNLITTHLSKEFDFYKKNGIRLVHAGNRENLPPEVLAEIDKAVDDCKNFSDLTVTLAINYGGQDEIVRAVNTCLENSIPLTRHTIEKSLDTGSIPPVDLLIRTGGEKRLSNFLLWQVAYAEFNFSDILWPDYTTKDFFLAVEDFAKRNRRFGGYNE